MTRRTIPPAEDARGVSDTISFVLTFTIIFTSVAIVYGTGFSALEEFGQGEQERSAQRAIQAIDRSLDRLGTSHAVSRGGTIDLEGGTFDLQSASVAVTVNGTTHSLPVGSLAYSTGDTTIAYENGAVFRAEDGNAVMLNGPEFTCRDGVAIVTVLSLRGENRTLAGSGILQIQATTSDVRLLYPDTRDESRLAAVTGVTVAVTGTEYGDAWDRYFDERGWTDTGAGGPYRCDADRVIVRHTTVTVRGTLP